MCPFQASLIKPLMNSPPRPFSLYRPTWRSHEMESTWASGRLLEEPRTDLWSAQAENKLWFCVELRFGLHL